MMLSLVNSKIAGAVPTVSWCKSLNQNQQTAREWQAAHFSTVRAAQMRAEVLIGTPTNSLARLCATTPHCERKRSARLSPQTCLQPGMTCFALGCWI